jgi:hypothetical protein
MRKALALLLATAAVICASATLAAAATITISPGGTIVAVVRSQGFEGGAGIGLFLCDVTLSGTLARGPITLAGKIGEISEVRTSECGGGHTAVASGLPWALTGQTALACPSESTGLLATVPARFTLDGILTGSGTMGVLFSSGSNAFAVLFARLSSGVVVLPRSGIYTQVQIFRCI